MRRGDSFLFQFRSSKRYMIKSSRIGAYSMVSRQKILRMFDTYNLSRNLNKIQKIWAEQGLRSAQRKLFHIATKSLRQSSKKRALQKRNIVFRTIDEEVLNREVERFLSCGLWRSPNEIKLEIKSLPSAFVDRMVKEGKRIAENEFILYGHLKVQFVSERPYWLRDPLTGFVWPLEVHSAMVGTQKPVGTDVKTIWEIARFQFLSSVAYAYILSDDERYINFVIEKIESWIEENPFMQGPHWTRAMEASIRLINWFVYLPLLDVFQFSKFSFRKKFAKSILEHLIYIRENLEVSPYHANNHYLANLATLLLCRLIFPSLPWAIETSLFAEKEFEREVQHQFKTSGINFEGSLPYHRLSSEICLIGVAIIKKSGRDVPTEIVERLLKAAEFTQSYTDICEECPFIGDNDNGIFVKFFAGQELNRHKYLKCLFDCILEDKGNPNDIENLLCSLHFKTADLTNYSGIDNISAEDENELQARDFDGLIIARHKTEGFFFNTLRSYDGHTHNDKLSIYPVIGGKLLFVDRGSFSYTGFFEKRHEDRMTSSHNGPVINGWEQSKIWKNDVFYMNGEAKCSNHIDFRKNEVNITGWHTGYGRYRRGLKTFRKVKWDIRKRTMLISDWVEGNRSHENFQFTWNFLINPAWAGEIENGSLLLKIAGRTVRFENVNGIDFTINRGVYCPSYQVESPCQALKARCILMTGQKNTFLLSY